MAKLKQRRLLKLWQERDGRCCWCGKQTMLIFRGDAMTNNMDKHSTLEKQDNEATIEHLNSKISGRAEARNNEQMWDMACHECNFSRAVAEQKLLGIDELRRRSKQQRRK